MGSFLASRLACCSGQMLIGFFCGNTCQGKTILTARLTYFVLTIIIYIIALIAFHNGPDMTKPFQEYGLSNLYLVDCQGEYEAFCLGISTVARLSFTIVCIHSILLGGQFAGGDFAKAMEEDCWHVKVVLYGAIAILTFFIPNTLFVRDIQKYYTVLAEVIAVAFLLLLEILAIDFAYRWSENWIQKYEISPDPTFWAVLLFGSSGLLSFLGLLAIILSFIWFTGDGCTSQTVHLVILLIVILTISGISVSSLIDHGSLLTSSVIGSFAFYLSWSGLSRVENSNCNSLNPADAGIASAVIDLLIITITVLYTIAKRKSYLDISPKIGNRTMSMEMKHINDSDDEYTVYTINQEEEAADRTGIWFHGLMIMWGFAICGFVSQWANEDSTGNSVLVKVIGSWILTGLFGWTIVAPSCCPDRIFTQLQK